MEEKTLAEALRMIQAEGSDETKKSFVLFSADWNPGVIGIVASRLTEIYHRPAILIALKEDLGKGSGRSMETFSLYEGLKACGSFLEKFGGHEQAAGLSIRRECIDDFARAFEAFVGRTLAVADFVPKVTVDAIVPLEDIKDSYLPELEALSPFGPGNSEPVLGIVQSTVLHSAVVGKEHLRLRLKEGERVRDAIAFGMGARHPFAHQPISVAVVPQINRFQGKRSLQLKVIDLRSGEASE